MDALRYLCVGGDPVSSGGYRGFGILRCLPVWSISTQQETFFFSKYNNESTNIYVNKVAGHTGLMYAMLGLGFSTLRYYCCSTQYHDSSLDASKQAKTTCRKYIETVMG